jgi:hypothetical protein
MYSDKDIENLVRKLIPDVVNKFKKTLIENLSKLESELKDEIYNNGREIGFVDEDGETNVMIDVMIKTVENTIDCVRLGVVNMKTAVATSQEEADFYDSMGMKKHL